MNLRRTVSQVAHRGTEAQQLLENPVFREAIERMGEQIVEQWKASSPRDVEGARLMLQLAQVSDLFEGILIGFVEAGKGAKKKIEDLDKLRPQSSARRFFQKVANG